MILYHYSVDSYAGAEQLTNDYKNNYRFAEPFLLALRESRAVFQAAFFAAMYMSREVQALGLRKYENYQKDAAEGIFEYIRQTQFPDEPSRLRCVFYCESEKEAVDYALNDCISDGLFTKDQVVLLEVEVEERRVRRYDQTFFNLATEAIARNEIDSAFVLAGEYFSCRRSEAPLIEVVSDGSNRVLRRIAY